MAYDEGLAERLRDQFVDRHGITEKKMFGGLAFMYRGHMLVGILGDSLVARVGPAEYTDALKRPHVREMDFNGKPMKGYVSVDPAGFESDSDLSTWIGLCLRFNESLPPK
jgi:hypothetical protein